MKNVIAYYYGINIKEYKKIDNCFKFKYENTTYIFKQFDGSVQELINNYNILYQMNFLYYELCKTINNEFFVIYNNSNYILLKQNFENKDRINYDEIVKTNLRVNFIDNLTWKTLWENKIDYYEYQMVEFGYKYEKLKESFNYYLGLSENAISLLNEISNVKFNMYISHKRIMYKELIEDLYDPSNIIFDSFTRDLSGYLKINFINDNIDMDLVLKTVENISFSNEEAIAFLSRMIYPSYYWDCYDEIVKGKFDEDKISEIIKKSAKTETLLKKIYNSLSSKYKIPNIDWLSIK